MKRKTFYYISLSLPYIALVFSGALSLVAYEFGFNWESPSGLFDILVGTVFFFSVSAIFWGPLYTWMAIVVLLWGIGKRADEVRRLVLLSPVLLGCSMGIPVFFVDLHGSAMMLIGGFLHMANLDFIARSLFEDYAFETSIGIGVAWAMMAGVCLVVGYMFVGIALLIERFMKRWNLFKEEERINHRV